MKPPRQRKFRILGKTWTVRIARPPCRETLDGLCNSETRTIFLHPEAVKENGVNIIAHEVGHAVLWAVDETHIAELGRCVSEIAGWVGTINGGELSHGFSTRK